MDSYLTVRIRYAYCIRWMYSIFVWEPYATNRLRLSAQASASGPRRLQSTVLQSLALYRAILYALVSGTLTVAVTSLMTAVSVNAPMKASRELQTARRRLLEIQFFAQFILRARIVEGSAKLFNSLFTPWQFTSSQPQEGERSRSLCRSSRSG